MAIFRWCSVIFTRPMSRPFVSWFVSDTPTTCNRRTAAAGDRANPGPAARAAIFPDPSPHPRAAMLTKHHTRCPRATPLMLATPRRKFPGPAAAAAVALLLGASPMTPAQPPAAPTAPLAASTAADPSAPPAPDRAMAVYGRVESWVRAGRLLPEQPTSGQPTPGEYGPISAASITLRLAGQVVGRGWDAAGDEGALARAVTAAIEESAKRMPIEKDALRDEAAAEARLRQCISLELAGPMIPYAPRVYDQVDLEIQAGLEGVAARRGASIVAVFPATMLANNTGPGDAMASAIAQVTGDPTLAIRAAADAQPAAVAAKHGLTLYRFKVTHLAQTGPGRPPIFLFRGGRIVPASEIDAAKLKEFADGMAEHLIAREWPGEEAVGLLGTAWPAQGKYDPAAASPLEQALVGYAMRRYAAYAGTAAGGAERARAAEKLADGLLESIAAAHPGESSPGVATAALAIAAAGERGGGGGPGRSAEVTRLLSRCEDVLTLAAQKPESAPPGERAIAAWGLARRAMVEPEQIDAADAFLRGVFRETQTGRLTSQMPWLGWAELALTRARGDGDIRSGPALREMRDQLWKHQLTAADAGADGPDLVGGIVFTASTNPLPTAVGLRPLAFAATMLGERTLTEDRELPRELTHVLASLRFVRQLAADEAAGFMYQEPSRAMWGIRSALWDQRQTPESTATALLMVVETLESLEARAAGTPRAPSAGPARAPKLP